METVTINPVFIKSLEKNRSALNAAFEYYHSGESRVEPSDIFNTFARLLNPLYDNNKIVSDKILISIFKSLLKLISKKIIGKSRKNIVIELNFFTIAEHNKNLLAEHGGVFVINIINVLINLTEKKKFQMERWSSLILSLPENIDLEEFRRYGFIIAWICGASSAGESAAELIRTLKPEIIKIIFNIETTAHTTAERIAENIIKDPWSNPVSDLNDNYTIPVFNTAGGFHGYSFEFRAIPVVVTIDEKFYATDGIDVYRLYCDYYGIELIRDGSVNQEIIKPGGVVNRFVKDHNFIFGKKICPLPVEWKTGITSIAFNSNTVVWTLKDSYKLYIAGITK